MQWFNKNDETEPSVTQEEINNLLKGDPQNLIELGGHALDDGNAEEAIEYYKMAGEAGLIEAYVRIGVIYQYGEGIRKSSAQALAWYRKAAAAGVVDAWVRIGTVYEEVGEYEQAIICYETQLKKDGGDKAEALFYLAKIHRFFLGDKEKALEYLYQSWDYSKRYRELEDCYVEGLDEEKIKEIKKRYLGKDRRLYC